MAYYGNGQLRHCWFGDYGAVIVLDFHSAQVRNMVAPEFPSFELSTEHPTVLRFEGSGAAVDTALSELRTHGADMKKVTSLKYSIDYGEPFIVCVKPHDGSIQGELL